MCLLGGLGQVCQSLRQQRHDFAPLLIAISRPAADFIQRTAAADAEAHGFIEAADMNAGCFHDDLYQAVTLQGQGRREGCQRQREQCRECETRERQQGELRLDGRQ